MSTEFKNIVSKVTCAICFWFSPNQLVANDLVEFRTRYYSDFEKIQNKLENVKGKMKLTTERSNEKGKKISTLIDNGDFAITGKYGKCSIDIKRSSTFGTLEATYVYCKLDDAAYKLSKRKGESRFTIESFDSPQMPGQPKGPSPLRFVDYQMNCGHLWTAPYLFYSSDWRSVLDSSHDSSVKIEKYDENGKKITRISYDAKGNNDLRIEIDIDTDFHHRILRSGFMSKKSGKPVFQYQVQYEGDSFIPKVVNYYSRQEQIKCEFSGLFFEATPLEEFQPAFFGIPDIGIAKSRYRFRNYLLYVTIFLSLILYVNYRRKVARYRNSPKTS